MCEAETDETLSYCSGGMPRGSPCGCKVMGGSAFCSGAAAALFGCPGDTTRKCLKCNHEASSQGLPLPTAHQQRGGNWLNQPGTAQEGEAKQINTSVRREGCGGGEEDACTSPNHALEKEDSRASKPQSAETLIK